MNNNYKSHGREPQSFPSRKEVQGWDPYEVWRTRVLLPRTRRLEDETSQRVEQEGELAA